MPLRPWIPPSPSTRPYPPPAYVRRSNHHTTRAHVPFLVVVRALVFVDLCRRCHAVVDHDEWRVTHAAYGWRSYRTLVERRRLGRLSRLLISSRLGAPVSAGLVNEKKKKIECTLSPSLFLGLVTDRDVTTRRLAPWLSVSISLSLSHLRGFPPPSFVASSICLSRSGNCIVPYLFRSFFVWMF